jgi:hypothetical protein
MNQEKYIYLNLNIMQIGTTQYSVGTANWKTRTPLTLKFICDMLMFLSLVAANLTAIKDPVIREWILSGGIIIKLLSNFISEHMPVVVQEQIKENPIEEPIKV